MATISEYRSMMKCSSELEQYLMPSTRNEIFLDLNGDGRADCAFIASTKSGEIDTIAIDLGCDGDFDLYLTDSDGNGVPDEITYYEDGSESPRVQTDERYHALFEKVLAGTKEKLAAAMQAGLEDEKNFIPLMKAFVDDIYSRFVKLSQKGII